ncbi:MAG: nucleotidyl transferase AbiEii/AbiGii toxin family protein [Actinomycetota bacterium]
MTLAMDDLASVMDQFGVAEEQVRRDHIISYVLAALSDHFRDGLIFFGGTALNRTFLVPGRLSEDIDVIARGNRNDLAREIPLVVGRSLLRTHGRVRWDPDLSEAPDAESSVMSIGADISIRIQLLRQHGYAPWPTELRSIQQRYSDSPPATLWVPTLHSFAAWKTEAWLERHAARDLYDLWGLARIGAISAEAVALFRTHGPLADVPDPSMFGRPPSDEEWRDQLAAQTLLTIGPEEALDTVRTSWAGAIGYESERRFSAMW